MRGRSWTAELAGLCAGLAVVAVVTSIGWADAAHRPAGPPPPASPPPAVVITPTPGIPICPEVDAMGVCEPRPALTA